MAVEENFINIRKKQREHDEKPNEEKTREIIYLPVMTVDQLCEHRKKRAAVPPPHDNLRVPSGSFRRLKSEYTRRFKGFEDLLPELKALYAQRPYIPQANLKLEGQPQFESEYEKSFGHEFISTDERAKEIIQKDDIGNVIQTALGSFRPRIVRQCTNLRLEGDFYHLTNYAENFIRYLIEKKEQLKRRETTLRLIGNMEHQTEFSRNFVPYENAFYRPPLCKKFTNLHLTGSLNLQTENRESFVPHKVEKHVPFTKKLTNLHLEGSLSLEPEYRSAYIEYKNYEKQKPTLPMNHIKAPMEFADFQQHEHHMGNFTRSRIHPIIPCLREPYESGSRPNSRPGSRTGSRPGSRDNSRPGSRAGSRPGSRAYSPHRPSSELGFRSRKGSADFIEKGQLRSVSHSPTMPNLRDKPAKLQPFSLSMREPPKIKINDEDERRLVRKDQRITYTKKLQPNLAPGLPPLPIYRGKNGNVLTDDRDSKPPKGHRSRWRSTPQNLNQMTLPSSPGKTSEDNNAFEGRFECQPEYRKAYHNYLMREKKAQSLDRTFLGTKDKEAAEIQDMPSSPNSKIKKNIEKMETLAFGPRCRRESFSSHFSSSDGEIVAPKSKFKDEEKKKSPKFHYKHKMTIDVHPNMYISDSEPSFVVVEKEF